MRPDHALVRWILLPALGICLTWTGCSRTDCREGQAGPHAGHGHDAPRERDPRNLHGHHDHDEPSDLDRPVEALFAAECEHRTKTFLCDACRHEVGIVRVPADLIADGLVRTTTAALMAPDASLILDGEVGFDERRVARVGPRTDGTVGAVHVQMGDPVTAGQPLFELDSQELADARSDYREALTVLQLARRTQDRLRTLHDQAIASEREVLEARQAFDAAQIRADAASERLRRMGLTPAQTARDRTAQKAGNATGRLVARSPQNGLVLDVRTAAGEPARTGEPLVVVGQTDPVRVLADLYEPDLAAVVAGLSQGPLAVTLRVQAFPDRPFEGTLDLLSPMMSPGSRTLKARITVPNPDGALRPGMFARVRVPLLTDPTVLAVPRAAVVQDGGRAFVFIRHQGDFWVRRPVEPGREWDDWVEVRAGLEPGAEVVADGAFLLKSDVLRLKMGAGCAD